MFPESEQRLVIPKDNPWNRALCWDLVVVNAVVYRQKVFQSVVAPLYVVEQGFSLVHCQCVGHSLQFEFDMVIGSQHCAACSMRDRVMVLVDANELVHLQQCSAAFPKHIFTAYLSISLQAGLKPLV